jgi:hypothetical protein
MLSVKVSWAPPPTRAHRESSIVASTFLPFDWCVRRVVYPTSPASALPLTVGESSATATRWVGARDW